MSIRTGGGQHAVSRRTAIRTAGSACSVLGLANLLRARAVSAPSAATAPDTSVILVWLPGGPSHMETYDLKPDAPSAYRGEFRPIATKVPGLDLCEHLPLHAQCADKFTVIRSIHHHSANHDAGHKRVLTGRIPKKPDGFVNDHPMVGSIVSRMREDTPARSGLYNYIVTGDGRVNNVDTFSFGAAYLGNRTHPFRISADPNADDFRVENLSLATGVSEARLGERATLLTTLDRLRRDIDVGTSMNAADAFNQRAIRMVTSPEARAAFDLSQERDDVRNRYGRHQWGQRALLARRLVEAGVSWVTVVLENPFVSGVDSLKNGTYNWDSHAVNAHIFDDLRVRLPIYDRTITALIEDIYARGLDRRVLLIVTGEFGRTPRINSQTGTNTGIKQPGRDHWPDAMNMLVSGGGMATGQVVGATTKKGEEPVQRPLSPNDLWASVYQHLGINPEIAFPDYSGRPMPILPFGEPIPELDPVG